MQELYFIKKMYTQLWLKFIVYQEFTNVVSAVRAPTYKFNKMVNKEIRNFPIADDNFSVENFVDFHRSDKTQFNEFLDFCACSLFPNVPTAQTIQNLRETCDVSETS